MLPLIYFLVGVGITLFILLIIGMYLRVMEEIKKLQTGVVYLVKREYEFEQSENEIIKEAQRKQDALNTIGIN